MKQRFRLTAILLSAVSLAAWGGCKVGPDYVRTEIELPDSYEAAGTADGVSQQVGADVSSWWTQINEPVLTQLTQEAIANNHSLREAYFRIQTARAIVGVTRGEIFPQFSANGAYTHMNQSYYNVSNDWNIGTSMTWELDVFGRLARLVEASEAEMQVQRETYRDLYVILMADIAQSYVDARSYQAQIDIAKENIEIQKSTYEITQNKSLIGKSSKLDESQALGSCRGTEATLLELQVAYKASLNRLSILVGQAPGYVDDLMAAVQPIPKAPESILVGIPADLLRRRPDVRAAEEKVIAQTARIGGAMGDLYPMFSLNGSFGLDASSFGDMFNSDSIVASVGPSFRWNILNFGRYRFNVIAKQFTQQELIATYEETVLNAAEEVDNALVSYVNERSRLETLREAKDAYSLAYTLSEEQYRSGKIDFQRLLDSQTGKLAYELQYVQCQASLMDSVISLYRALGGDWMNNSQAMNPESAGGGDNVVAYAQSN